MWRVGDDLDIRTEEPGDREAVRRVNEAAFDTPAEADLVDALRESGDAVPELCLVAVEGGEVVGHICLSHARLRAAGAEGLEGARSDGAEGRKGARADGAQGRAGARSDGAQGREGTRSDGPGGRAAAPGGPQILALAPMAVLPERQRRGVGSALVQEALERANETTFPLVVVLGHPDYYPRFGFDPASAYGVECPYEGVPDEAWMAQPLAAYEPGLRGRVVYAEAFGAP